MLPKTRRLRKRGDFDRIFQTGRVVKRAGLRLVLTEGSGLGAVVVARSVGSNAFRNTIRRRWREALGLFDSPSRHDFVFVVGGPATKLRGSAIPIALQEALAEVSA